MSSRLNEVQASMNAVVNDFAPVDAVLLFKVRVEARFDVLHDGPPTGEHTMAPVRGLVDEGRKNAFTCHHC